MNFTLPARPQTFGILTVNGMSPGIPPVQRVLPELQWLLPRRFAPHGLVEQVLAVLRSNAPDAPESSTSPVRSSAATGRRSTTANAGAGAERRSSGAPSSNPDDPVIVKGPFSVEDLSMEDLVREHADAVYRVALSVTRNPSLAEDASQDALIKAWQALPSFRGDAPLRNWILRITHNTAVTLLRKRRDELRDPNELPDTVSYKTVESQVHDRLALDRFELALKDLDSLSRSIVVLREVEGLSYDEICDVLELPMPTVKTRLLRARRQLAVALDGWQP